MGINDNPLGVSGTTLSGLGDQNGALYQFLKQTSGGSSNAQRAIDLAGQLVPQYQEVNPWEVAFQYFAEMGRQASQPGATALGAAVGSMQVPLDYLNAKKKEKRESDSARLQTALTLGPSLKPEKATYSDPKEYMISVPIIGEDGNPTGEYQEAYRDFLTAPDFAKLQQQGARFTSVDKTSATAGQITLSKYLDPSRIDDPETKTVNEQIIQLTAAEYQARMAAGNPVYPLSATDSALNKPDRAPIAKKTTFYKNGTTLAMFDTGPVLYKGGKVVAEEDFDTVNDEGLRSGILNTMSESAASEAGKSAIQIGTEAFVTMGKLQEEMKVLERAKELVLPEGGANTGWLASKLPSIWAASIELDNIQSKLGLAVVGQNTFGALSKGELDLALATALPKTMNEAELADWIDRKIIAQGKLIRHYSDAASYLTNPLNKGGIAAWVDIKREAFEAEQGAEAIAAAAVITNMSEEEFDAITSADKEAMTIAELQAYLARLQGQ